jgi:hypothetical protein
MVSLAFGRSHEWAEGIPPSGNELRCGIGGIFLTRFLRPSTLITPACRCVSVPAPGIIDYRSKKPERLIALLHAAIALCSRCSNNRKTG